MPGILLPLNTLIKYMFVHRLLFCLLWIGTTPLLYSQTTLEVDRATAVYQVNETIEFTIQTTSSNIATYTIYKDRYASIVASGEIQLSPGATIPILYQADSPGSFICRLVKGNQVYLAPALVAPFSIQPQEEVPIGLMDFWNAQLAELANVPIDPVLEFEEENQYITSYEVSLATVNNRRVYGYVSIPKGPGPFPAVLTLPSFGDNAGMVEPDQTTAERGGAIGMTISIHNVPADEKDDFAYQPDVITNPDSLYYKLSILAAVRAIDYIFSRNDFDGESLAVNGTSQGGGLATIVAGLDQRVKLLVYSNSALAQHHGLHHDQASGFPYYLNRSNAINSSAEHIAATLAATKYIDALYFAQRFTGPSLGFTGLLDTICPTSTVIATYNQLRGPKTLGLYPNLDHSHPDEYWDGRYSFYRRHFPAMQNPPWPWPDTETGYLANAGEDQTINLGNEVNLSGWIEKNGEINTTWSVEWQLEEGKGPVLFSNPNSRNTNAVFCEPGTYLLRFTAYDQDELNNSEPRFFAITDYITITVN